MAEYPKMMVKKSASNTGRRQRARNAEEEAELGTQGYEPLSVATDGGPGQAVPQELQIAFDDLTKIELLQYAHDQGIAVNQYAAKREILETIKAAMERHNG